MVSDNDYLVELSGVCFHVCAILAILRIKISFPFDLLIKI